MTIICYYGSWSFDYQGDGKFQIEDIDPNMCSHLIYAFAGLGNDNKIKALKPSKDLETAGDKQGYFKFNSLKNVNKQLKTLIAIGGWNEGSIKYSNMSAKPETRRTFIDSVMKFLADYGFDGLDIYWEFPGTRGGITQDKQNFATLLKELKHEFTPKGYILTAAVSSEQSIIEVAYDVPSICRYLDFINVMCYDYHGNWERKTGHNSPLFARPDENEAEKCLNVDYSIKNWLSRGAPKEKLVMGIPFYGRSFTLQSPLSNGLGAPVSGVGEPGPYNLEPGYLGFNEFCEMRKKNPKEWTVVRDSNQKVGFAFRDNQWVGFEDKESITEKANYAKSKQLAGAMIWTVDTDDFKGKFGQRYPLLNSINKVFQK